MTVNIWNYYAHLEADGSFKPVYQYSDSETKTLSDYMSQYFKTSKELLEIYSRDKKRNRIIAYCNWFSENDPGVVTIPDIYFGFVAISRALEQALRLEEVRPRIPIKLRNKIRIRDKHTCFYCRKKGNGQIGPDGRFWHLDHKMPYSLGGSDDEFNLVLACSTCNVKKHNLNHVEFLKKLKLQVNYDKEITA